MPKNPSAVRTVVLTAAILAVLMSVAPVAHAVVRNQDPGGGSPGGGGGNTCVTQSCAFCAQDCNLGGCWEVCGYGTWSEACACWFESGVCSPNGECTYVP